MKLNIIKNKIPIKTMTINTSGNTVTSKIKKIISKFEIYN